jgi:hypothetical protein
MILKKFCECGRGERRGEKRRVEGGEEEREEKRR